MFLLVIGIIVNGLYRAGGGRCYCGTAIGVVFLLVATQQRIANDAIVEGQTGHNYDEDDGDDAECRESRFTIEILLGGQGGGRGLPTGAAIDARTLLSTRIPCNRCTQSTYKTCGDADWTMLKKVLKFLESSFFHRKAFL